MCRILLAVVPYNKDRNSSFKKSSTVVIQLYRRQSAHSTNLWSEHDVNKAGFVHQVKAAQLEALYTTQYALIQKSNGTRKSDEHVSYQDITIDQPMLEKSRPQIVRNTLGFIWIFFSENKGEIACRCREHKQT